MAIRDPHSAGNLQSCGNAFTHWPYQGFHLNITVTEL
jgi:hypothetical protein